jgi:hypothetical protein
MQHHAQLQLPFYSFVGALCQDYESFA